MTARERFYCAAYAEGCLEGFNSEMTQLGELLRMTPVQIREAFRISQWEAIVKEFRLMEAELCATRIQVIALREQLRIAKGPGDLI